MYTISSLDQLRARLGLANTDTADDPRLLTAAAAATAAIERAAGRRFLPRQKAIQHNYTSSLELLLDDDLLELTGLTNGGSTIALNDVIPAPDEAPYCYLRLTGSSAFTWVTSPLQAITVSGIWGWHDRPISMWRLSGDSVQNNPLTSGATTLTVTDADGTDDDSRFPRFQVGHLLRIDSEYLAVTAVNTITNVLTVQRAANGTTAASHALNTPIYTYQPPAELNALALRWASWLYKQADTAAFEAAPDALTDALIPFRRVGVKV
ncbi:MAG: hypothetical protein LCI00_28070 [Chloroflexi bacterium]|nr:hypothetical protein [Chloroflexota bacterium]MCC6893896.1 hypothetical protein [Anaerolineae bacterium]